MLKNDVAVVGAGLGGATVAYGLQQKNYRAYLINGSEQDNRTIPDAKNVLILEGYDGLAGDRSLALEALQRNKQILKPFQRLSRRLSYALRQAAVLLVLVIFHTFATFLQLIQRELLFQSC